MRYLLAIYLDEHVSAQREPAEVQRGMATHAPYLERLLANRQLYGCDPLWPTTSARTLTDACGRIVATAGPYAESREQFGGYYLVDAPHLDAAIDLAGACPALATPGVAGIEIRPVYDADASARGRVDAAHGPCFMLAALQTAKVAGTPIDDDNERRTWARWSERRKSTPACLEAVLLQPADTATTLRLAAGRRTLTDGPFAPDADAQLSGYWLVRAASFDAAAALATALSQDGPVEVRAVRGDGPVPR